MSKSFVYLIGPKDWRAGWVKIGRTANHPRARLSSLQTGNPYKLELYSFFNGGVDLEAALHRIFQPLRLSGEWFGMDGRLLNFVSLTSLGRMGERITTDDELRRALQYALFDSTPNCFIDTPEGREAWYRSADLSAVPAWLLPHPKAEVASVQ